MATNEVGRTDEAGLMDGARSEAQVGYRHRAGLLRVVHEITLCVVVRIGPDDTNTVVVGANGTI